MTLTDIDKIVLEGTFNNVPSYLTYKTDPYQYKLFLTMLNAPASERSEAFLSEEFAAIGWTYHKGVTDSFAKYCDYWQKLMTTQEYRDQVKKLKERLSSPKKTKRGKKSTD